MLLGKHTLPMHADGKIVLPSEYRQPMARTGAVLTCGMDHNILILTKNAFEKMVAQLSATSMTDPLARTLNRLILGNAVETGFNAEGGFQVPAALAEFAGLGDEIVLVGQGAYLELWSASAWGRQVERMEKTISDSQGFEKFNVSLA